SLNSSLIDLEPTNMDASFLSWNLAEAQLNSYAKAKGEHNHQLQSDIGLYAPKYRKLSSKILEKIEFYVTKGKIGTKQMLSLLTSEFPDHIIHKRDLYNAIQKVRRPLNQCQEEAQEFENLQLDYDNGFLENQLDRPQNSIIALIKDIDLSDIIEIWELICLSMMMNTKAAKFHIGLVAKCWYYDDRQDIRLEDLQPQSIEISTMFQQTATNIAVPDFHIIEKIRDTNTYIIKNQQAANKKARYANRFGRMKKALNIALDLGCEEELIYVMSSFINQKKSAIENIDNENIQPGESQQIIVMDPLVVKHRGRPSIKRLKSFSESYDHKKLVHDVTNLQDPNLEMPPSNIDLNSYVIDNNANELCHEGKRKYVCNLCGGVGHNSRTCKKQE
ncbi:9858_t:CDS:2, partial [Cetraspora pellucida]